MRKIIFDINITLDGFADHTAVIADDELHDYFTSLMDKFDAILFGRKTYELMESFWPTVKDDPTSKQSMIDFADKINPLKKIVYSRTLDKVTWQNTELCKTDLIQKVKSLQKGDGKGIAVGSISLAEQLMKADLIDEFYFVVHPVLLGKGKPLFEKINVHQKLKLLHTTTLNSGAIALHYQILKGDL